MIRRLLAHALAILIVGFGALGPLSPVYAQNPTAPWRVGVLLVGFSYESKEAQAFRQGLRDAGYSEGRDVMIEWQFANGDYRQIPPLVAELVQSNVNVIVVDGTPAARAALRATSTIPIVMALVADPVGSGLVTSLARPGANITGLSLMKSEITAKRLQLLKDAMPRLTRVAVLWNPDTPWHTKAIEDLKAVAPSLSIALTFTKVQAPEQFGQALSAVNLAHAQALYVIDDPFFYVHRASVLSIASTLRLPCIYGVRGFVDEGGLMSYAPDYIDLLRRSAGYVDKILRGSKPGDLPIEQPTKFEFAINLRTAKTLGLTIPESILLRADEVIR